MKEGAVFILKDNLFQCKAVMLNRFIFLPNYFYFRVGSISLEELSWRHNMLI